MKISMLDEVIAEYGQELADQIDQLEAAGHGNEPTYKAMSRNVILNGKGRTITLLVEISAVPTLRQRQRHALKFAGIRV
jgi:hypothetical protein